MTENAGISKDGIDLNYVYHSPVLIVNYQKTQWPARRISKNHVRKLIKNKEQEAKASQDKQRATLRGIVKQMKNAYHNLKPTDLIVQYYDEGRTFEPINSTRATFSYSGYVAKKHKDNENWIEKIKENDLQRAFERASLEADKRCVSCLKLFKESEKETAIFCDGCQLSVHSDKECHRSDPPPDTNNPHELFHCPICRVALGKPFPSDLEEIKHTGSALNAERPFSQFVMLEEQENPSDTAVDHLDPSPVKTTKGKKRKKDLDKPKDGNSKDKPRKRLKKKDLNGQKKGSHEASIKKTKVEVQLKAESAGKILVDEVSKESKPLNGDVGEAEAVFAPKPNVVKDEAKSDEKSNDKVEEEKRKSIQRKNALKDRIKIKRKSKTSVKEEEPAKKSNRGKVNFTVIKAKRENILKATDLLNSLFLPFNKTDNEALSKFFWDSNSGCKWFMRLLLLYLANESFDVSPQDIPILLNAIIDIAHWSRSAKEWEENGQTAEFAGLVSRAKSTLEEIIGNTKASPMSVNKKLSLILGQFFGYFSIQQGYLRKMKSTEINSTISLFDSLERLLGDKEKFLEEASSIFEQLNYSFNEYGKYESSSSIPDTDKCGLYSSVKYMLSVRGSRWPRANPQPLTSQNIRYANAFFEGAKLFSLSSKEPIVRITEKDRIKEEVKSKEIEIVVKEEVKLNSSELNETLKLEIERKKKEENEKAEKEREIRRLLEASIKECKTGISMLNAEKKLSSSLISDWIHLVLPSAICQMDTTLDEFGSFLPQSQSGDETLLSGQRSLSKCQTVERFNPVRLDKSLLQPVPVLDIEKARYWGISATAEDVEAFKLMTGDNMK